MVWAQIMPFVALLMYRDKTENADKHGVTIFLTCSFSMWLLLNVILFCTIDVKYIS